MVKLSVVVPVYNRANTVINTIESVLSQSFVDFELIIVDDGSSDNLSALISSIIDPRVRYLYQENAGANTARNLGIDSAKGEYVALLDSDDLFLSNHLETAIAFLDKNPNIVFYSRIIVDRGDNTFIKPPRAISSGEHMSNYLMCDRGFLQTSTLVLKTETARKIRYREGLPYGQDMDFAVRLFAQGLRFYMSYEPTVVWKDLPDKSRISSHSRPDIRLEWLESVRPLITTKAYYGYQGWFIAKAFAQNGFYKKALTMYFTAMVKRSYSVKLSVTVLLQILLVGRAYRTIADSYLKLKNIFN